MATLNVHNLPDEVVEELRARAKHSGRNVEDEAASVLTRAVNSDPWRRDLTSHELIERARKVREGHPDAWVTEEFLRLAKNEGRA